MEFTQKIKEAVNAFVSESKTNFNELKYTAESTLKNVISEAQDELEVQKNNLKTTSERVQAKLKGPFTLEKVQNDVQEELNILVGEVKNSYTRNAERVKNLVNTAETKVKAATSDIKEEVKKATKTSKAKA